MDTPEQKQKDQIHEKWWVWLIVVFFIIFIYWSAGTDNVQEKDKNDLSPDVNDNMVGQEIDPKLVLGDPVKDLAEYKSALNKHIAKLRAEIPQLSEKGIYCQAEDCIEVVFSFTSLPEDYKLIIQGNTEIISNIKFEHMVGSDVNIIAEYNDQIIFNCFGETGLILQCFEN